MTLVTFITSTNACQKQHKEGKVCLGTTLPRSVCRGRDGMAMWMGGSGSHCVYRQEAECSESRYSAPPVRKHLTDMARVCLLGGSQSSHLDNVD